MINLSEIWYDTNVLNKSDFDASYLIFLLDPLPTGLKRSGGRPRKIKLDQLVKLSRGRPVGPRKPDPEERPLFTRPHEQTVGQEFLQQIRDEEVVKQDVAKETKRQEEQRFWRRRGRKQ